MKGLGIKQNVQKGMCASVWNEVSLSLFCGCEALREKKDLRMFYILQNGHVVNLHAEKVVYICKELNWLQLADGP